MAKRKSGLGNKGVEVLLSSSKASKKVESEEVIAVTKKAEGEKCLVCWKINKNGCERHPV